MNEVFGVNSVEILIGGDFMKKILFILLSFCLAGEMEIDGDLTVLGSVNAPGLGGMKPERIYRININSSWSEDKLVPEGKMWLITVGGINSSSNQQIFVNINGISTEILNYHGIIANTIAFPNESIQFGTGLSDSKILIYEYPISGSGTDQGMDYIEP